MTASLAFSNSTFAEVKGDYPEIDTAVNHIDALAAFFVMKPHAFDVIVASNLFGDILTDLGGAIMGSIGIAPAANLNIEREYPSMFEPVHGSAPDIAGKGIANNVNRVWVVGNGSMLNYKVYNKLYWSAVPGIVYIDVPEHVQDEQITVLAVLLDGPIKLYRGEGQVITAN